MVNLFYKENRIENEYINYKYLSSKIIIWTNSVFKIILVDLLIYFHGSFLANLY